MKEQFGSWHSPRSSLQALKKIDWLLLLHFFALFVFYCLRWIWSMMIPYKKLRPNWSRIYFLFQQLHTYEVWIYHKVQVKYGDIWIGKGTFLDRFCWQTTVWELVCYWAGPLLWNSQVSCGQMGPALLETLPREICSSILCMLAKIISWVSFYISVCVQLIIRGQRGKNRFAKGRGKCTLIERSRWTWEKAKRGWIWNVSGGEPLPAGTRVTPSRVLPPSPSVMVPTHTNAETYTVHTHKWTNTYTQMHKCTVTYKVSQKKWLTEFGKKALSHLAFCLETWNKELCWSLRKFKAFRAIILLFMSIGNKSINQGKYQLILSVTFFGTPCVYCSSYYKVWILYEVSFS